ncbi:hypothetical protein QBC47DRAFT_311632, partial [Echria macrotheca]
YLGKTLLHLAVLTSNEPVCSMLLHLGADVNAQDMFGQRPLDVACSERKPPIQIIKLLVQSKAETHPASPRDLTPLQ